MTLSNLPGPLPLVKPHRRLLPGASRASIGAHRQPGLLTTTRSSGERYGLFIAFTFLFLSSLPNHEQRYLLSNNLLVQRRSSTTLTVSTLNPLKYSFIMLCTITD